MSLLPVYGEPFKCAFPRCSECGDDYLDDDEQQYPRRAYTKQVDDSEAGVIIRDHVAIIEEAHQYLQDTIAKHGDAVSRCKAFMDFLYLPDHGAYLTGAECMERWHQSGQNFTSAQGRSHDWWNQASPLGRLEKERHDCRHEIKSSYIEDSRYRCG